MNCIACQKPTGPSDYSRKIGQEEPLWLCLACYEKCVRGGRSPANVIDAVLIFRNDPDVGGPHDPLDHEDYRDCELLGLWPADDKE